MQVVEEHDPTDPLFLYLAYQAVHAPREVPAAYADRYNGSAPYNITIEDKDRRDFAGMLTCMDEGIGNVTNALKTKGMLDDTLIVFTTDNGGPVPDTPGGDYVGSRNFPLRGGKHSIWEGGTRGTAFVWAGKATNLMKPSLVGAPVTNLMHGVDWLSTFCTVAGLSDCGAHGLALDGIDMSGPLFQNTSGGHDYVLYGQHDDAPNDFKPFDDAIRDAAGWKLIQGTGGKPNSWSQLVNVSSVSSAAASWAMQQCTTPNCAVDPPYNPHGLPPTAMKLPSPNVVNCAAPSSWEAACYPGNDLENVRVAAATDCCAACSKLLGCVGWTFNAKVEEHAKGNCFLKKTMGQPSSSSKCTSGGATSPSPSPSPPPSPSPSPGPAPGPIPGPVPGPEGSVLLFNVATDPGEHHDVSGENPVVVARLAKVLNAMRATATATKDVLKCGGSATKKTPQGSYVVPNCNITG